jgi:FMN-dependent NADH-azoreductase
MKTILHIDASARGERSLTRRLSRLFIDTWLQQHPQAPVIRRDLGVAPPPFVTESWIAAAFSPPENRDADMRQALAWSDTAIAELKVADLIVIGAPMYNYGPPAILKAWLDQVIRIGRTFTFDLARGDWPIEPIMQGKRLVVLSSRGEFGFAPGEEREMLNQFDPHLATCAAYLGVARADIHTIAIEYQEFGDARHARSRAEAEARTVALADTLAGAARLEPA